MESKPPFGSKVSPKLIVFDLDYTLWPLWVDTHVDLPVKRLPDGSIVDRKGDKITLYVDVIPILDEVKSAGIKVAFASRTGAIEEAESLLDIMDLNKYIIAKEIYPGSKIKHFSNFKTNLGIDYSEMVFFDDEERNIGDLLKLGVTAIHTPTGISWKYFKQGMAMFSSTRQQ